MDPGSSVLPLCLCLCLGLATVRLSSADEIGCPCPEIPAVNLTDPPPTTCFEVGARFRYTCKAGFVRKAGTSNLITCVQDDRGVKWKTLGLECIVDPRSLTREPEGPAVTVGKPTFVNGTTTSPAPTQTATSPAPTWTAMAPPDDSTVLGAHGSHGDVTSTHVAAPIVVLVLLCALVGLMYFCKRRSPNTEQQPPPEQVSLRQNPSEPSR